MDTKQQLAKDLAEIALRVFQVEVDAGAVQLETPRNPEHGDISTNLATIIAKHLSRNPVEVAMQLAQEVNKLPYVGDSGLLGSFSASGIFVSASFGVALPKQVLGKISADYGKHQVGQGKQVMVEFGQPNTHKAFHVGHLKSAVSGLAISRLYQNMGYKVVQANFYGDVGMHVAKTTWGLMHSDLPADIDSMDVHQRMKIVDACYVKGASAFKEDKSAEAEIREINQQVYDQQQTPAVQMYAKARDWSLQHLDNAFARLGIEYDRQYPESEVYSEAIELVKQHQGNIFEISDGAWIFAGEKLKLNNWVFITKEGHPTYEAKDLALAYKKFAEYDLSLSIITTSVEQSARFKAIIYILEQIDSKFTGRYLHVPFGWLLRDNKKTSSRMGDSIKGMDVIDEAINASKDKISQDRNYSTHEAEQIAERVGLAGLKFLILSHEFHKDINYDPEEFTSYDGFSGPYLLYAVARCKSIIAAAREQFELEPSNYLESLDLIGVLNTPVEQSLLKKLMEYPSMTQLACQNNSPHVLARYLYDLTVAFSRFYETSPVLNSESAEIRRSRLAAVDATRQVLENGLWILGIETVQKL